jgi:hypothetical protein
MTATISPTTEAPHAISRRDGGGKNADWTRHICRECEYFDLGVMGMDGHSDCLNPNSPRFQTYDTQQACPVFLPDTSGRED